MMTIFVVVIATANVIVSMTFNLELGRPNGWINKTGEKNNCGMANRWIDSRHILMLAVGYVLNYDVNIETTL